jgi:hypothetical protein
MKLSTLMMMRRRKATRTSWRKWRTFGNETAWLLVCPIIIISIIVVMGGPENLY